MPYVTEDEVKLATELGYTHKKDFGNGSKFQNGDRFIWSIRMSTTSGFGWQSADLNDDWFKKRHGV